MSKSDLTHVLNAIEAAQAEFEELMLEKEWYVTEVNDHLLSARMIVLSAIKEIETNG